jgi:hypothetical protein
MIKKSTTSILLIIVLFAMTLSACGSPQAAAPTLDMNLIFTQVGATMQMGFTQTAQALPTATQTPEPTMTLSPAASVTLQPLLVTTPTLAASPTLSGPTPLPVNPATANGCYNASLVSESTVPNRPDFKPGDTFTKTWRLINTGTCDWNGDFKIAYVSGSYFGSDTTKIRQRVGVGVTGEVSLEMTAPSGVSGTVVSNWQLITDTGLTFGPVLTASIILPGSNATATSVGCYSSALVSETIPSGSRLDPGERFEKTWQIKNTGTCEWTRDFKFTYIGGYDFQGADTTAIRQKVPAGSTVEVSMSIDAPNDPESYTSSWQLTNDEGDFFGQVFTIDIRVK